VTGRLKLFLAVLLACCALSYSGLPHAKEAAGIAVVAALYAAILYPNRRM
jgi:hypothetical protein